MNAPHSALAENNAHGGIAARLIGTTKDLISVLERENSLLESRRPQEVKPLQAEKTRLAAQYRDDMKTVKRNKALLGPDGSLVRLELEAATERFQEALKNHGRILLRKKSISEGMIHAIGAEVERQKRPVQNYTPGAMTHKPAPSSPTSIALNEVI